MTVLIFDGYVPGDEALENSHWMAQRTNDALGGNVVVVEHPQAIRVNLEQHLKNDSVRGLALFGHGDAGKLHTILATQYRDREQQHRAHSEASEAGAVYGCDGSAALDMDNIHFLCERWCHAIACNVGLVLADRAIDAHATCFVAYDISVTPEFEIESMPECLKACLARLIAETTTNLHAGTCDPKKLKEAVINRVDELSTLLDDDKDPAIIFWSERPGTVQGLLAFANQLWRNMRVVVTIGDNERNIHR